MFNVEIFLLDELWRLVPTAGLVPAAGSDDAPRVRRILREPASVKDIIEAMGIPHCEVGAIMAAQPAAPARRYAPSRFNSPVRLGDLIAADLALAVRAVGARSLVAPRFLCDQHLGKLAGLLRMTGFDTAYDNHWAEPELARRALNEDRVVLSRSRKLLKRKTMDAAMLICSDRPDAQLSEVIRRFVLADQIEMFGRCSRCNDRLVSVAKTDVQERIPPRTSKWLDVYYLCTGCDQLYWEGTHVHAIKQRVDQVLAE